MWAIDLESGEAVYSYEKYPEAIKISINIIRKNNATLLSSIENMIINKELEQQLGDNLAPFGAKAMRELGDKIGKMGYDKFKKFITSKCLWCDKEYKEDTSDADIWQHFCSRKHEKKMDKLYNMAKNPLDKKEIEDTSCVKDIYYFGKKKKQKGYVGEYRYSYNELYDSIRYKDTTCKVITLEDYNPTIDGLPNFGDEDYDKKVLFQEIVSDKNKQEGKDYFIFYENKDVIHLIYDKIGDKPFGRFGFITMGILDYVDDLFEED